MEDNNLKDLIKDYEIGDITEENGIFWIIEDIIVNVDSSITIKWKRAEVTKRLDRVTIEEDKFGLTEVSMARFKGINIEDSVSKYQDLKTECEDLVTKYEKLVDFFKTLEFYELPRVKKNLLYRQNRVMNEYIQILGERMELEGINDFKVREE